MLSDEDLNIHEKNIIKIIVKLKKESLPITLRTLQGKTGINYNTLKSKNRLLELLGLIDVTYVTTGRGVQTSVKLTEKGSRIAHSLSEE